MSIIKKTNGDLIAESSNLTIKKLVIENKADLTSANLTGANLTGADLNGADFRGANLTGANLNGADLECADLTGANLKCADLRGADLNGADLRGADLRGAKNWQDTSWAKQAKQQLRYILSFLKSEIPNLIAKIQNGEINGTQYKGECCCLIGTLGNQNACNVILDYEKGLENPAEQLFWQIREGDTPDNSEFAKLALEICEEFINKAIKQI